jgi:hypothetical protein
MNCDMRVWHLPLFGQWLGLLNCLVSGDRSNVSYIVRHENGVYLNYIASNLREIRREADMPYLLQGLRIFKTLLIHSHNIDDDSDNRDVEEEEDDGDQVLDRDRLREEIHLRLIIELDLVQLCIDMTALFETSLVLNTAVAEMFHHVLWYNTRQKPPVEYEMHQQLHARRKLITPMMKILVKSMRFFGGKEAAVQEHVIAAVYYFVTGYQWEDEFLSGLDVLKTSMFLDMVASQSYSPTSLIFMQLRTIQQNL